MIAPWSISRSISGSCTPAFSGCQLVAVNPSVVDRPPYASDSAFTSAPASSSSFVISTMFFGVFCRKSSTPFAET